MNIWKIVSLGAIVGTLVTLGFGSARAQVAACNNQPNMSAAVSALRKARGYLERAEHDKGGWRARAVQSTDNAIRETERGCAFADTH
jgi:hypothetical protein